MTMKKFRPVLLEVHACESQGEKEKRIHAHNFKIEKIIVSTQSIEIEIRLHRTSKQDLTPLCFNNIIF